MPENDAFQCLDCLEVLHSNFRVLYRVKYVVEYMILCKQRPHPNQPWIWFLIAVFFCCVSVFILSSSLAVCFDCCSLKLASALLCRLPIWSTRVLIASISYFSLSICCNQLEWSKSCMNPILLPDQRIQTLLINHWQQAPPSAVVAAAAVVVDFSSRTILFLNWVDSASTPNHEVSVAEVIQPAVVEQAAAVDMD